MKKMFLSFSLFSLFASNILLGNQVESIIDIEVNKLNQALKKEIELVNMIESYLLLQAPTSIDASNKRYFDPSLVTISKIQQFYNLPNNYFNNYDGETCALKGSYCDENSTTGINIKVSDNGISITNLLGKGQKSDNTKRLFQRLHKKYKAVIFDNSFNTNGTVNRTFSNKIYDLKSNLNGYLENPYHKSVISFNKPTYNSATQSPQVWIKPDGEGAFYTYGIDDFLGDYKLIGKNITKQFPTYNNYQDLQNVKSFNGAIMYARYQNKDSNYSKYGEMEFINSGKSTFLDGKQKWSIKAGNNVFIKDEITISNTCSEIKNPIIGIDANDRYVFRNGSTGTGQTIGETLTLTSVPGGTEIEVEELFYFFRSQYSFKLDPTSAVSPEIKINYENPTYFIDQCSIFSKPDEKIACENKNASSNWNKWKTELLTSGSKSIKNNYLSFEVFNKIKLAKETLSNIELISVKFYDYKTKTWITKTPISNEINGSDLREIQLKLKTTDYKELDDLFLTKYKPDRLGSGRIASSEISDITFDTSNIGKFFGDSDAKVFDSNIDVVPAYPILVKYKIKIDSVCSSKKYDDCFLVQTGNRGCYISEVISSGQKE